MTETTETTTTEAPPANANTGCVGPTSEAAGKASACAGCPNQNACTSGSFSSPAAIAKSKEEVDKLKSCLGNISHTILVLSGKGGVGKSTVASQLAQTLSCQGYAVGLLDVDLCGPSAPRMVLGDQAMSMTINRGASGLWTPVYNDNNVAVVSISFLLQDQKNQAVIWRGPRKNALIQQFLTEVDWTGETEGLDYLIVDTPPGTSDEHISTVQYLQKASCISGAVVVTTAEEASLSDVRKELSFCQKTNVPVLGVIENMSMMQTDITHCKFINKQNQQDETEHVLNMLQTKCPDVLSNYAVLSDLFVNANKPNAVQNMCRDFECQYWGKLPHDPKLLQACEQGQVFIQQVAENDKDNEAAKALSEFCQKLSKVCPVDM